MPFFPTCFGILAAGVTVKLEPKDFSRKFQLMYISRYLLYQTQISFTRMIKSRLYFFFWEIFSKVDNRIICNYVLLQILIDVIHNWAPQPGTVQFRIVPCSWTVFLGFITWRESDQVKYEFELHHNPSNIFSHIFYRIPRGNSREVLLTCWITKKINADLLIYILGINSRFPMNPIYILRDQKFTIASLHETSYCHVGICRKSGNDVFHWFCPLLPCCLQSPYALWNLQFEIFRGN